MGKSIMDQIIENKDDLILKFLQLVEGKEATTNFNLDDVKMKIGDFELKLDGNVTISVISKKSILSKKKKK